MDVPFIYLFISPPPNLLSYFFCPKETKEFSLEKQLGASCTFARFLEKSSRFLTRGLENTNNKTEAEERKDLGG